MWKILITLLKTIFQKKVVLFKKKKEFLENIRFRVSEGKGIASKEKGLGINDIY